jgi:hypothetical protein
MEMGGPRATTPKKFVTYHETSMPAVMLHAELTRLGCRTVRTGKICPHARRDNTLTVTTTLQLTVILVIV